MWHETPINIRYADTDQMGVVHHAVYPIYCEIGRTDMLASHGLPYHDMEAEGIYLMVVDMTCRYRAPARYGDAISVRTSIEKLKPKLLVFAYEIVNKTTQKVLYTGTTTHLFSEETRGAVRCPPTYWQQLEKVAQLGS